MNSLGLFGKVNIGMRGCIFRIGFMNLILSTSDHDMRKSKPWGKEAMGRPYRVVGESLFHEVKVDMMGLRVKWDTSNEANEGTVDFDGSMEKKPASEMY